MSYSGLRDNTTYYVQILATNTAQRSNMSCMIGFTTLSTKKGITTIFGYLVHVVFFIIKYLGCVVEKEHMLK